MCLNLRTNIFQRKSVLTPDPDVVKALKEIETAGLPLADWYKSVFSFVVCSDTPDRFAQSAQSARELMEKVSEVVVAAQKTQTDAKSTLTKLAESFAKAKRNSSAFLLMTGSAI